MTRISTRHENVARDFAAVADLVTKWDAPTPVPEWTAGDIVEHLLGWFPGMLQECYGLSLRDVPGRSLAERWRLRAVEVQALLDDGETAARTVESGDFAGMRLDEAVDRFYIADIFMHTWDLARAANVHVELDGNYANRIREGLAATEEQMRASGQFGDAVDTDSDDAVDRLVAFIGRDPQWRSAKLAESRR